MVISMNFQIEQQVHGRQNISIIVVALYTPEELEALTETMTLFKPCIGAIYADLGGWRDTAIIRMTCPRSMYQLLC